MANNLNVPEDFETIARHGLGKQWHQWAGALKALESGLGQKTARFDAAANASLYVVTVAGWWYPFEDTLWEHAGESLNPFLLRSGYAVDPSANAGDFDNDGYGEETEHTRLAIGDPYKIPFQRSTPDVSRRDVARGYVVGDDSYEPLGYRGHTTEFLLAVSAEGIWRVAKDGSFLYWSMWDEVLSAETFENLYLPAGDFGQDDYPHCLLVTLPKKLEQIGYFRWWINTSQVIERMLAVAKPSKGELSSEDAETINQGLEHPSLSLGGDRAEFFTLSPADISRFKDVLSLYKKKVSKPRRAALLQKLDELQELEDFGLGGLVKEFIDQQGNLKENFDCDACGGVASCQELVDLFRKEWAQFDGRLPTGVSTRAISVEILSASDLKKVRPATLQREFGVDYAIAVEILEVSRMLGYGGPGVCGKCLTRRATKNETGAGSVGREALPPSVRFAVLQRDGFRCRYCGMGAQSNPPVELEVDHVVPVAAGGGNDLGNLVSACINCNRGKSAKPVV